MEWLEVSLEVDGELAEAIAEMLARHCENGVTMEQGVRHLDDEDAGTPDGLVTVRAFLAMDETLEETRLQIEEGLHFLRMIQPIPPARFRRIADENWMESWRRHYRPIKIGRHLVILPAWMHETEPARISIKINPGMAFGTGTHPSTQLCLEFMDSLVDPNVEARQARIAERFIDVGCGSGILSIAARKLGVGAVVGVDIDAVSIQNARENGKLNEIQTDLTWGTGSVAHILDGQFPLRSADLVAANILAPVIVRLFDEGLARLVEPDGLLILAGILESQARDVAEAARRAGLKPREQRQKGEWVAMLVARSH